LFLDVLVNLLAHLSIDAIAVQADAKFQSFISALADIFVKVEPPE